MKNVNYSVYKKHSMNLLVCLMLFYLNGCSSTSDPSKDTNVSKPNPLAYPQECNVKLKANDYMCNSGKAMAVRREGNLVICQKQCAEHANWQQTLDRSPRAMQLRTYTKGGTNMPNQWLWQQDGFKKDLKSLTGK